MKIVISVLLGLLFCVNSVFAQGWRVEQYQPVLPVLIGKDWNPVLKIVLRPIDRSGSKSARLSNLAFDFAGTTDMADLAFISIFPASKDPGTLMAGEPIAGKKIRAKKISVNLSMPLAEDSLVLWVAVRTHQLADLRNMVNVHLMSAYTDNKKLEVQPSNFPGLKLGVALHNKMDYGVHTARIPGLVTATDGTLLAMWDARYENDRDLQGDIDIVVRRSEDHGRSWSAPITVLDMKNFGGLPEKFNGVSDANILVDKKSGKIFVFGLWMHGVINAQTGKNETNLNEFSPVWNHQWRSYGSQPGYDLDRSSQVLMAVSSDQGKTWSDPVNITTQVKRKEWWLLAPAPGRGITLKDGTLVFPSEGRDETGKAFSSITFSKDGGRTWKTSAPTRPYTHSSTNECAVVQLDDGRLMLNMRESANRDRMEGNGRVVVTTSDLGQSWQEHPTSHSALIESGCMASLFEDHGVLYFLNPSSKSHRDKMTLKTSFNQGKTWPEKYWILLDQYNGNGYSCITNYDDDFIAVLYEGSQADMVFQLVRKPIK